MSQHVRANLPKASKEIASNAMNSDTNSRSIHSTLQDLDIRKIRLAEDQTLSEGIPQGAQNTGYFYSQLITGSGCGGTPYYITGSITNTCIVSSSNKAQYYTCQNGIVSVNIYNTSSCSSSSYLTTVETHNLGCYRDATAYSQVVSYGCTTDVDVLPLSSYYYGVEESFNNTECSGRALVFNAYINNKCYLSGDQYQYYSYPYQTLYPSGDTGCGGNDGTTRLFFYPTCDAMDPTDLPTLYMQSRLVQGMIPTLRPSVNYVPATSFGDDGNDDSISLGLGGIAAIALTLSGFIGIVFFLGFFFAVKAGKRSNSMEGNEMSTQENPVSKLYT